MEQKINIVLLGGSNSVGRYGLQKGLSQDGVKLHNLALGSTTSIQNLYELKREKNIKYLLNADLIITESNVNEHIAASHKYEKLSLRIIYKNLYLLYSELSRLEKKVLVLLLPGGNDTIDSLHKYLIGQFSLNLIDVKSYYKNKNILDLVAMEGAHPFWVFMRELGKNIVHHIPYFHFPKNHIKAPCLIDFKICSAYEMEIISGNTIKTKYNNSMYNEEILQFNKEVVLTFPEKYHGYHLLAVHTWNKLDGSIDIKSQNLLKHYTAFKVCNKRYSIIKISNFLNSVVEFQKDFFQIIPDTTVSISLENEKNIEFHHAAHTWDDENKVYHDTLNLVSFFLIKSNFKIILPRDMDLILDRKYIFDCIIPPMEIYKQVLDEFCTRFLNLCTYGDKLHEIKNLIQRKMQENNLNRDILVPKEQKNNQESEFLDVDKLSSFSTFQTKYGTAKQRIQNQLSYKLGQAMITNSKSLLGYIRMPFVLSYIKDKHKQEQKIYQEKIKKDPSLKLPPLENYPDYKEALKEKECLTYKLGEALIRANNNWYGGGISNYCLKLGS